MADIAMLVAEEYERRVKNSRKYGGGEEIDFLSGFSTVSQKLRSSCSWVLVVDDAEKKRMMDKVLEPRSGFSVAARNGFFSA
nr:hypothetical protein POPTR_007G086000 [Ipomoea batatas]GMD58388.1 hypothetical protein POPTR_007G086000 [Ipomoea batatas]